MESFKPVNLEKSDTHTHTHTDTHTQIQTGTHSHRRTMAPLKMRCINVIMHALMRWMSRGGALTACDAATRASLAR